MNFIYCVNRKSIDNNTIQNLTYKSVGEKALGLTTIPEPWTPAFFVISSELSETYYSLTSSEQDKLLSDYERNVTQCCKNLSIEGDIIIRSSCIHEGMLERGQYESIVTNLNNIKSALRELLEKIGIIENGMPFVVQKYITPKISGHVSNERRFSKDKRDWQVEYYFENNTWDSDRIAIRRWRKIYDLESLKNQKIECTSIKDISEALRSMIALWTEKRERVHIEFTCNNEFLYLVQVDKEISPKDAVDPTKFKIKLNSDLKKYSFSALRTIRDDDKSKFNKINNVFLYREAGLPTVPIYVLDNKEIIDEVSRGIISNSLESDLKQLVEIQSIVIRTDINSNDPSDRQMLRRSNEIKNYELAKKWLIDNSGQIIGKEEGVFIFHNFVPAISSAFAHAKPGERSVEIQALWGLPEGLYYNSHDTILVDLGNSNGINPNEISIIKRLKHKGVFITPVENGEWKPKLVAEPHDWSCSISDDDSIREIALGSRRIADKCGKEISIMWFAGIDTDYYSVKNIPWYHEEYKANMYTPEKFKRKYFKDEEFIIKTKKDLIELKKKDQKTIKCIRIKPDQDDLLRSKEFITEVGSYAKENDIRILLEGARLAHSYYQLFKTGAIIVSANADDLEYYSTTEFNKLVRDKIPEKIISGGESVKFGYIVDELFLGMLLEKLLEETYEVMDSDNDSDLIEELADVFEICEEINNQIKKGYHNIFIRKNDNPYSIVSPNYDIIFNNSFELNHNKTIQFKCFVEGSDGLIIIEREKGIIKFELNIFSHLKLTNSYKQNEEKVDSIYEKKCKLVKLASSLITINKTDIILELISSIYNITNEILIEKKVLAGDFEYIRSKKLNKNGAFEKGCVLLETNLMTMSSDDSNDSLSDLNQAFTHISYPKFNSYRYNEIIVNEEERNIRLLLRGTIPLGFADWTVDLSSDKIDVFFNKPQSLSLRFYREGGRMLFDILKKKNENIASLSLF